jgi:hypothetical protein
VAHLDGVATTRRRRFVDSGVLHWLVESVGRTYSKERRRGRGGARSTGSMATFLRNSGEAGGSPAPTMDEMKRGEHGGCHAALWWRRKEGGEKSWAAVTDAF